MTGHRTGSHPTGGKGEIAGSRHFYISGHELAAPKLDPALYLVATPIGNLSDITIRVLETLAAADVLACEDTRVTRILLDRYGISRRATAYHEHNAATAGPKLLAALEEGKSVALASDAGTPLVSDPGYRLVRAALERGVRVVPLPGPSALLAALQISGLPTDQFCFAGFLPVKSGQRRRRLSELASVGATLIFFESPRRLSATLADMTAIFGGQRSAAVCRELTKTFEESRRASLGELAAHYAEAGSPKGEVVIVVGPPENADAELDPKEIDDLLLDLVRQMPASRAAAEAARRTGLAKSDLYRRLLEMKDSGNG
jgi:16S rRNA (cytidine1402-2'-O)-methyltransferase